MSLAHLAAGTLAEPEASWVYAPRIALTPRPARPAATPLQAALAADAGNARREAWLGLGLAALAVLMLLNGWLWPVLALGFAAAPLLGLALEGWALARQPRPAAGPARAAR
jgi:hypothetical protein